MSHVVVPNYRVLNPTEYFQGVWMLTRAMIAAGWKYKASADATGASNNKDTSGTLTSDKWGVGGGVNLAQVGAQTGTSPTIGAPSSGVSVVSGVSGFVANSVGRFLRITGAINPANNGIFRITAQAGTTASIFHPGAIAETGTSLVAWTEMQGGAAASIAAAGTGGATPGRAIVSGLTGMAAPTASPLSRGSVGDYLTIIGASSAANLGTFRITRVISTTSVEIENSAAVADANNGTIIWAEMSPTQQVYPGSLQGATGAGAWLVLQGPSTIKVPIGSNVPTGAFLRGEKVTQSTSGATGTILGVMTDVAGATGFLVVMPRLNGTGGGVRGWTTGSTDTITGAFSGATVTSTTTAPIEFVREMVFWKSTQTAGHIYVQCVDQSGESASRFSALATNAAITNVLAPGSSAGGGFPTPGSWVVIGTGATAAVGTGALAWFHTVNALGNIGNMHIMVADCMETSTADQDGSWTIAVGTPNNSPTSYGGMFYMRVDSSEDGDLDPYVTCFNFTAAAYAGTRTGASAGLTNNTDFFQRSTLLPGSTSSVYAGWRRRGFSTTDAWQQFVGMCLTNGSNSPIDVATASGISHASHSIQTASIREAAWIVSTNTSQRMRKGYLRWLWLTEGGVSNNTYQNGTWVQLSQGNGPMVAGPWDGQTRPLSA